MATISTKILPNSRHLAGCEEEVRRTAVVAETHSPPHVQRASLALVIEGGGGSEANDCCRRKQHQICLRQPTAFLDRTDQVIDA